MVTMYKIPIQIIFTCNYIFTTIMPISQIIRQSHQLLQSIFQYKFSCYILLYLCPWNCLQKFRCDNCFCRDTIFTEKYQKVIALTAVILATRSVWSFELADVPVTDTDTANASSDKCSFGSDMIQFVNCSCEHSTILTICQSQVTSHMLLHIFAWYLSFF